MAGEPKAFCAICIDGTEDLVRAPDGCLECRRCRQEDPVLGDYSFNASSTRPGTVPGCGRNGGPRRNS